MYLEELTGSIKLENLEVECRACLDRQNPQGWIKTVGGFSNIPGGIFYIGVEDKTFKQIGFTGKEADQERITSTIKSTSTFHQDLNTPFPFFDMSSTQNNCLCSKLK